MDREEDLFDHLRKLRSHFRGTAVIHFGGGPEAVDVELHEKARGGRHAEELLRLRAAQVTRAAG